MADSKTVEAVQKALEESKKLERKFKQSVDVVINLKNIDMNDAKNRIEDEVLLPHGRGTDAKLALFASGDLALKSKSHVDLLIKPEEIEELAKDKKKFKKIADEYDFFIAEAPLMPTIGKTLGIILGPRGKMPKPVPPTIDIAGIAKNLRKTVKVRSKTTKTINATVGQEEMSTEHIAENIDAILKRLEGKLERGKMNIGSVYVKTSMGPPMRIG
ncbi:MAG: 50S ribosomal protein L1 [Candidatus Thermoplasmatota archaeon]|jgi:large subunit ribosomal protein L1|nr:50S ribosomal protein L1 [Candidatus Thermoplasmatota archaeon]